MELELAIPADHAAAPARLKPLAAVRDGRPRSLVTKTVWHDSPEHALRADGLALAESRGTWRLERLFPDARPWLPGQPAPCLAEGAGPADLRPPPDTDAPPPAVPTPLAPLAAYEGKRSVSRHHLPEGIVTIVMERGILRAVTAEAPVARLLLSGDAAAVRAAALLIAAATPAALPRATLAAQGIALATGWTPPARRLGAPALPPHADDAPPTPADAFAHILGHLLDVLLHHATRLADGPEAVHQMRVAVRRARSAVSMFGHVFGAEALAPLRAPLRELNARLGPTRDWDVLVGETLPTVLAALPGDDRLARLIAAAQRRRDAHHRALETWLAGPEFRLLTIDLAWHLAAAPWLAPPPLAADTMPAAMPDGVSAGSPRAEPPPLRDFAAAMLHRRWKQLTSAGKGIEAQEIAALHDLRLRAKRLRYAAEMFAALWPGKAAHRFIHRLADVQQRLGVLNDGAVAADLLTALGGAGGRHGYASGLVIGFLAARAARARPRIEETYGKFRRQAPYWT